STRRRHDSKVASPAALPSQIARPARTLLGTDAARGVGRKERRPPSGALDRYIPLRCALTRLRRTGPCVVERRHDAAPTRPPGGVAPLVSRRVPGRIPPAHRHPASSDRPADPCRSLPPCNPPPAP